MTQTIEAGAVFGTQGLEDLVGHGLRSALVPDGLETLNFRNGDDVRACPARASAGPAVELCRPGCGVVLSIALGRHDILPDRVAPDGRKTGYYGGSKPFSEEVGPVS